MTFSDRMTQLFFSILTVMWLGPFILLLFILLLLNGCSINHWKGADGTTLDTYSLLDNKKVSGSFMDDGKSRKLIVKELDENQTEGISKIVGAAVEAAVKGVKP